MPKCIVIYWGNRVGMRFEPIHPISFISTGARPYERASKHCVALLFRFEVLGCSLKILKCTIVIITAITLTIFKRESVKNTDTTVTTTSTAAAATTNTAITTCCYCLYYCFHCTTVIIASAVSTTFAAVAASTATSYYHFILLFIIVIITFSSTFCHKASS